jgi:hypothetical protein
VVFICYVLFHLGLSFIYGNLEIPTMEALKDIIASTVGSAACVLVGQPFDTIKVRLQVLSGEYTSSLSCVQKTITTEGFVALWKGATPAFAGAITENATAFAINGVFHRLLGEAEGDSHARSPGKSFVLGAAAGFFTAFVLCPTDIVKCRQQVYITQGRAMTTSHIAMDLYRSLGWRGFTLGLGPQIWRDIAFFAFFFGTYDYFTAQLQDKTKLPTEVTYFLAGGLAGAC